MRTQKEKGRIFRDLHNGSALFVIPNPWDAGTAKLLTQLGYKALTTTGAGFAFTLGRPDGAGRLSRREVLANAAAIAEATDLPVAADLENGFGDTPKDCAQTIRLAIKAGLVGGSIEDVFGAHDNPVYEMGLAVDRVRAAAAAAHDAPIDFCLTARADGLHFGQSLKDVIARLQAYQEAGADCVYAPGLKTRAEIEAVTSSVDVPVNVAMGYPGDRFTVSDLQELGVRRVSLGSVLARVALGAFVDAARQTLEHGTFDYGLSGIDFGELNRIFAAPLSH